MGSLRNNLTWIPPANKEYLWLISHLLLLRYIPVDETAFCLQLQFVQTKRLPMAGVHSQAQPKPKANNSHSQDKRVTALTNKKRPLQPHHTPHTWKLNLDAPIKKPKDVSVKTNLKKDILGIKRKKLKPDYKNERESSLLVKPYHLSYYYYLSSALPPRFQLQIASIS